MDGVRRDARTHGALGASRGRGRRFPLGALILRYFAYVLAALLALALGLAAAHRVPAPGSGAFALNAPCGPRQTAPSPVLPHGPVAVNSADADELDTLPGVGEVIAQRIIEEREENGPFYYPEDLMNVNGIGEKTLEKLLPHIRLP